MTNAQILVVEDEAIVALNLQTALQEMGYLLTSVTHSGEEALERISDNKPDLVLMDIQLSGKMDGIDVVEKIRTFSDVPVIYITAFTSHDIQHRAAHTMPKGYIIKPVRPAVLRSQIKTALVSDSAHS